MGWTSANITQQNIITISAVFQGFSKFDGTVKENVGVGFVDKVHSRATVEKAVTLGGADSVVNSLSNGLQTYIDSSGLDSASFFPSQDTSNIQHGLSHGEVSCADHS